MSTENTIKVILQLGKARNRQRGSGHSVVLENVEETGLSAGVIPSRIQDEGGSKLCRQGAYVSQRLNLRRNGKASTPENDVQSRGQNRTREIRPSGIVGRPVETGTMVRAKRARTAETLKRPSLDLRSRASQIYPDNRTQGSARGPSGNRRSYLDGSPLCLTFFLGPIVPLSHGEVSGVSRIAELAIEWSTGPVGLAVEEGFQLRWNLFGEGWAQGSLVPVGEERGAVSGDDDYAFAVRADLSGGVDQSLAEE